MSASGDATRASLILRIRDARDTGAWETFLETYVPMVYRYCRCRGLQDSDAADVTQEVMVQVARSARTFEYRPERGRFRDWLGTITRRTLQEHFRRSRRANQTVSGMPLPPVEGDTDPEWVATFHAFVLNAALIRTRPAFAPSTWRAFEIVWVERRTAEDAARELEVPVASIYVSKSRVLKRLRAEILALAEDLPIYSARN